MYVWIGRQDYLLIATIIQDCEDDEPEQFPWFTEPLSSWESVDISRTPDTALSIRVVNILREPSSTGHHRKEHG